MPATAMAKRAAWRRLGYQPHALRAEASEGGAPVTATDVRRARHRRRRERRALRPITSRAGLDTWPTSRT